MKINQNGMSIVNDEEHLDENHHTLSCFLQTMFNNKSRTETDLEQRI